MGLIGYVAGVATGARGNPASSASAVAATPFATRQASASITPRPESATPATPEPSAPPPWAWRRTEFQLGELLHVDGVWGLGDDVIAHGTIFSDTTYMLTFGGQSWPTTYAPRAIAAYWGGLQLDGRLWFLVVDEGLRRRETSLRLAGTTAGANPTWKALGPSNLDPDVPIRFLGHIADTWVAAYIGEGGNIEIGAPQFLVTSTDGIHWSPARVPGLRGVDPFDVGFNAVASTNEFMVVQAFAELDGGADHMLLVSRDGIDWRETRPFEDLDWTSTLACTDSTCVLTRWAFDDHPIAYPMPIAWASTDGVSWTPAETMLRDEASGSGLMFVEPTSNGFVGLDRETNVVWLSTPDGLSWRSYAALPADLAVPIIDLAVGGDTVVALEQEPDVATQGAWVGHLPAMRIAD
jgi:hypothetical protein